MASPCILKVILVDNTCQRLTLPCGLPQSVSELMEEVQRQCGLTYTFNLQFMDPLFNDDFMNLTSVSEIQNRGTIKVVNLSDPTILQSPVSSAGCRSPSTSSFSGVSCPDTDILSSTESQSEPSTSRSLWPDKFCVPQFSFDSELKLDRANAEYKENGTLLTPDNKLLSNILDGLVQEIVHYGLYITDNQFNSVGEALILKHPCLSERGSVSGYAGWKHRLKNKLSIYRTQLRKLGCHEVTVNALSHKPQGKGPAFAIKKPRRSEVNYCPPYPTGETEETLETLRVELKMEVKKRNGKETVHRKMDKTFSYRRLEVVRETPMVQDFQERWPALFKINAEFKRITTLPLQSRFLSQLDILSSKLIALYKKRGGLIGKRLKSIMDQMTEEDVDHGRESVLKGLCVYLNEDPEHLIRQHVGVSDTAFEESVEETTVGIFTVKQQEAQPTPDDVGIILEGQIVIQDLDNVPLAVALLFGLLYPLNMDYPHQLRYTFEVIQKLIMELDGGTLSKKVQVLKNRLNE
ncbi:uncharacterized protein LOC115781106 isoform X2 [Archocentrus centrarchus]|uniref:uncharacterized protein LOC115781106 isoform X2 n=1 Tax=Archocentrus centrarchus TaxID=63155 RepID=UPI0011EA4A14|nr:uncharacterized protein LOC115781106 isoform X2 [Archocentrus centrarchus]